MKKRFIGMILVTALFALVFGFAACGGGGGGDGGPSIIPGGGDGKFSVSATKLRSSFRVCKNVVE